jgi:hypothetical protein
MLGKGGGKTDDLSALGVQSPRTIWRVVEGFTTGRISHIQYGANLERFRTQTGHRTYTRTFCQKNERSVKIKQRPARMCGRTIYRTLSHENTLFQIGIDR